MPREEFFVSSGACVFHGTVPHPGWIKFLCCRYNTDMKIDARIQGLTETMKRLKELFPSCNSEDTSIDVLTHTKKDAQQIRAFAAMSGFKTALHHESGFYRVSITGASCGCYR